MSSLAVGSTRPIGSIAGAASGRLGASKNLILVLAFAIFVLFLATFGIWLRWENLPLSLQVSNIASLLAPLVFAAAIIERALEILVSPWRDAEANKLEAAASAIKAKNVDPATSAQNAADLKAASDASDEYRGETQRYAFCVSLALCILASVVGIRALGPLLDSTKFHATTHAQQLYFLCLDVGLSAALLAGGADGIHSVMNAFTTFFDETAQKAKS